MENALLQSEARLRAFFAAASVGIVRLWLDGTIAESNPAFAAMLGILPADVIGRKPESLVLAADRAASLRLFLEATGAPESSRGIELRYVHRDGSTVWGEVTISCARGDDGEVLFFTYIVQDISERKRLEVMLRHAQKLESVGRLSAGVAHEINTPIQFIGDNVQFLRTSFETLADIRAKKHAILDACELPPGLREQLAAVDEAADLPYLVEEVPRAIAETTQGIANVSRIVKAMKHFAHPDRGEEQSSIDINDAIESTVTVAGNELKYVADVRTELEDLPLICCYAGDVSQVLLNLLVNAADAIAERAGNDGARGSITLRSFRDGDHALVTIEDTGGGIPDAIRSKVFDPFFTTKEVGRGTGQGLALARGIVVDKHKGELWFESVMGVGTTFNIRLPIAGAVAR